MFYETPLSSTIVTETVGSIEISHETRIYIRKLQHDNFDNPRHLRSIPIFAAVTFGRPNNHDNDNVLTLTIRDIRDPVRISQNIIPDIEV